MWFSSCLLTKPKCVLLLHCSNLIFYKSWEIEPKHSFKFFIFYLFSVILGLHCWVGSSLVVANRGYSLVAMQGLSLLWLLLLWISRSRGKWGRSTVAVVPKLQSTGSVVAVPGLSCFVACGILPDQGSNPHPLHWQAGSQALSHQGSSRDWAFKIILLQIDSYNKLFSCSGYDCIMSKHLESKNLNYFGLGPTYCHRKQIFMWLVDLFPLYIKVVVLAL